MLSCIALRRHRCALVAGAGALDALRLSCAVSACVGRAWRRKKLGKELLYGSIDTCIMRATGTRYLADVEGVSRKDNLVKRPQESTGTYREKLFHFAITKWVPGKGCVSGNESGCEG